MTTPKNKKSPISTSAMKNHLERKHAEEYVEYLAATTKLPAGGITTAPEPGPSPKPKQLTLEETTGRQLLWDINDARSKKYHYLIGEMIALDNEPLSMVERVGFTRLMKKAVPQYNMPSRKYVTENIIPDIYNKMFSNILAKMHKATAISVTSDIWTCQDNNASFISFTAHWLSPEFDLEYGVLAMKSFDISHTGDNISNELTSIAARWDIPDSKIHLVVHDSGANMIKGVRLAEYPSAKCFIHSIQPAIEEALKSQEDVSDMVHATRRIVSHFNHYGQAKQKLKAIRQELNLPDHQLVEDVVTRWNSTFYLMQRLIEQRRAVSLYISDSFSSSLPNLTPSQWDLMGQCIVLLKPFEELTKITSSGLSCISEVIPFVSIMLKYLGKDDTAAKTQHLQNMRSTLRSEIIKRFNLEENYSYILPTFLDPRFKTSFLNLMQAERAKQNLLLQALKLSCDETSSSDDDELLSSPSSKRRNTGSIHDDFWSCYVEVATENVQIIDTTDKNTLANEISHYKWWAANSTQYPTLAQFAKRYLSAPCSSVYSERLFSEAGLVYEEKRNRLLLDNAEKLVFIHHNLPLLNYRY